MVPLQLVPNITLASGLVDLLFFCRLMLELASGKTTVMGEAGDGWFSVFASSPTLFANLCIVCIWFHTLTNLSFFGISRWVFSLLHTSHCVGQRQQGLYTAKGSHKSLLQVLKSLGMFGNQNWTSSDFLTCSTTVDAAFFLSEIHSSPSFQCSGLEEFFLTITQPWNRNEKKSQNPRIQIWIAGTKSSATTRSRSSREKDTIHVPRKTQRWTQLNYSCSQSEIEEEKEFTHVLQKAFYSKEFRDFARRNIQRWGEIIEDWVCIKQDLIRTRLQLGF